jgi:hypothetical protein
MPTRRDFLRGLLGAAAFPSALLAQQRPRRDIRVLQIGVRLPEAGLVALGAQLGLEEAKRTAGLLAVQLRIAATSSEVLVGLTAPEGRLDVPLLVAGPPEALPRPARPGVFRVAAGPAARERALAKRPGQGLRVMDWHPLLERFGADQLNERFHRRFGRSMDESAWRGWVAVKIAVEAALASPPGASMSLADRLRVQGFDGHKGMQLRFDPRSGHLIQPVYLVDARGRLVDEVKPE